MAHCKRQLASIVTLSTLLFVIMCASVLAESSDSPGSRGPAVMKRGKGVQSGPDYRLNMMTSKLALSEEQRTKIKPILDDELAQLEALRGNDSLNRDERRAKLQQLNKETSEKIRPFLTTEQQKSQDDVKQKISNNRSKERNTRPGPNPGENTPDSRLQRLTRDLGLTGEQQAKIKPILLEEYTQLEAMRGNDSLNRDQRREKLIALNKATSENIRAQITAEQQKKYDAIRQKIEDRRTQTKIPNSGKPK